MEVSSRRWKIVLTFLQKLSTHRIFTTKISMSLAKLHVFAPHLYDVAQTYKNPERGFSHFGTTKQVEIT
jgi:hypothetical protein